MLHQVTASIHALFYICETCFQLDLCITQFQLPDSDAINFYLSFLTIITTIIAINIASLAWVHQKMDFIAGRKGLVACVVFHIFCLGPLWRYFKIIFSGDKDDALELTKLRLIQVVIQNTSFIILHIITIWDHQHLTPMSGVTLSFSILSLVFCFTLYEFYTTDVTHASYPTRAHVQAILPRFFWHFFFVLSRLISILLFSYMFNLWILLVLLVHNCVYITVQGMSKRLCCVNTGNKMSTQTEQQHAKYEIKFNIRKLFSIKIIVGIIDVLESDDRLLIVCLHYCLLLAENSIMCMAWYIKVMECIQCQKDLSTWPLVASVYGAFIVGSIIVTITHLRYRSYQTYSDGAEAPMPCQYSRNYNHSPNVSFVNELSCYLVEAIDTEESETVQCNVPLNRCSVQMLNMQQNSGTDNSTKQLEVLLQPRILPNLNVVALETNTISIADSSMEQVDSSQVEVVPQVTRRVCKSHDSGYQTPPEDVSCMPKMKEAVYASESSIKSYISSLNPTVRSTSRSSEPHLSSTTGEISNSFSDITNISYSTASKKKSNQDTSIASQTNSSHDDHKEQLSIANNIHDLQKKSLPQTVKLHHAHNPYYDTRTETSNYTESTCECCRHKPIRSFRVRGRRSYEWSSDSCSSSCYTGSSMYTHSDDSSCWSGTSCTNTWPQDKRICSYNLRELPREVSPDEHVSRWLTTVNSTTENSMAQDIGESQASGKVAFDDGFVSSKRKQKSKILSGINGRPVILKNKHAVSVDNIYRSMTSALKRTARRTEKNDIRKKQTQSGSQQSIWKHVINKWKS